MLKPSHIWSIAENGILDETLSYCNESNLEEKAKELEYSIKMGMFKNTVLRGRMFSDVSSSKLKVNSYSTMVAYNLAKDGNTAMSPAIIEFMESREVDQDNLKAYITEKTVDWVSPADKTGNVLNDTLNYYYKKETRGFSTQCRDAELLVSMLSYLKEKGADENTLDEILNDILDKSVLDSKDIVMTLINLLVMPEAEFVKENQIKMINAMRAQLAYRMLPGLVNWEYLEDKPVVDFKSDYGLELKDKPKGLTWGNTKAKNLRQQINNLDLSCVLQALKLLSGNDSNIINENSKPRAEILFSISESLTQGRLLDLIYLSVPGRYATQDMFGFIKASLKRFERTYKFER